MPDINAVDVIVAKRDGGSLPSETIHALIDAYTRGDVPDYQMSAFLMASFFQGMHAEESTALTQAMLHSGTVLDLTDTPGVKVDKHSTGGVGDKISLLLAPIVAACGVPVPMISGRGLGHTGGTLDKLESIPGFRTDLSISEYRQQLEDIGVVMIGQTAQIAPADRKLYALRDVTGTVESIPLIAASIMSKKLAEGIDALVLDVKAGRGAFMKTEQDARELAETLVAIGERAGTETVALLTRMDVPLGRAVGNWPEVKESVRCLRGEGEDLGVADVMAITIALAAEMLVLGGAASDLEEGHERARQVVQNGRAFDKMVELVARQGGDTSVLHEWSSRAGSSPVAELVAPEDVRGYVSDVDALSVGRAALAMGAGRRTKEDTVDPTAGVVLEKKPGDAVESGAILAKFYGKAGDIEQARARVRQAFSFSPEPVEVKRLLLGRYTEEGWEKTQ